MIWLGRTILKKNRVVVKWYVLNVLPPFVSRLCSSVSIFQEQIYFSGLGTASQWQQRTGQWGLTVEMVSYAAAVQKIGSASLMSRKCLVNSDWLYSEIFILEICEEEWCPCFCWFWLGGHATGWGEKSILLGHNAKCVWEVVLVFVTDLKKYINIYVIIATKFCPSESAREHLEQVTFLWMKGAPLLSASAPERSQTCQWRSLCYELPMWFFFNYFLSFPVGHFICNVF